ncbi:hypothetical protein [Bradyrhizobium sp. sGM-13]|uniref:hypothetical protein n=1 Tax=Bradyrhizobium sp. sGM-13 TaxID=2831781 RepID=UPI001BD1AA32|nr:hypothetical protein [Bradyrhizobium sp. sGM-13]
MFTLQPNGLVALQTAHFAVYLTYSHTDVDNGHQPQNIPFPGGAGGTGTLQISRRGVNETLVIKRTRLLRRSAIRRSNEVGILMLFDVNNPGAVDEPWIDAAGWAPVVPDLGVNADNTRFAPSRASFGAFQERFVHEVGLTTNNQGVTELALVLDLQQQPMTAQITGTALAGHTFPTLSLRAEGGGQTPFFLPNSIAVPVRGCVMAAVGAFAQMDADLLLRSWVADAAELTKSLSELIWSPHNVATGHEGRMVRKVGNVHSTDSSDNSLFGDASVVREALYMQANPPAGAAAGAAGQSFHPDPGFI